MPLSALHLWEVVKEALAARIVIEPWNRTSHFTDAAKLLVNAFIGIRIDYCNSLLYGISDTLRLHSVQNNESSVIRLVSIVVTAHWHTTQRAHHAGVEVTPLVASSPAYHVQGRHHRPQMSRRSCCSVPVQPPTCAGQRPTGMRSASAAIYWKF